MHSMWSIFGWWEISLIINVMNKTGVIFTGTAASIGISFVILLFQVNMLLFFLTDM